MDDIVWETLLNDLESDRVERKASISDCDQIREAISIALLQENLSRG